MVIKFENAAKNKSKADLIVQNLIFVFSTRHDVEFVYDKSG